VMVLYSRPDYYVKTFTARNCSLKNRSHFTWLEERCLQ
jgi:hypothetical protein